MKSYYIFMERRETMKEKGFFRNLMLLLCACFALTAAVFATPREVKAGGNGLVVDIRLWSSEEECEIYPNAGQRAWYNVSTGADYTVTANRIGTMCRYEDLWFDLEKLPPIGTVFSLAQIELPEGYMLDYCQLPMKQAFSQAIYDRLMESKANGWQALENITFMVYVRRVGTKIDMSNVSSGMYDLSWTGKPQKPHCELSYHGIMLKENKDYTVTCSNNTNIGTAHAVFKGIGEFTGTKELDYRIRPIDLYDDRVTVSNIPDQKYTGKAIKPSVTVKVSGKTLKAGTDYTLKYENNINVGQAFVRVVGKGNYEGEKLIFFKITGTVKPNLPAKGSNIITGNGKYKVTKSAASGGTVTFTAPKSAKEKTFTIPSAIKLGSVSFKVTAVEANAFKNNKSLTSVTVGKYVNTIGNQAFYGDSKLKTIKITGPYLKSAGKNALKGIYSKAVIKVPAAQYTAYKKILSGKGQAKTVKITK